MPDITRIMVSRAHNELLEKEFKPASANKSPIYLRSAFNLAIKWNIPGVTTNPADKFDLFPKNNMVERCLSQQEAAKLLASAERTESELNIKVHCNVFDFNGCSTE